MELDFLSPRAKEISQKKTSLIVCLKEQNIQSSDLINDHVWFMKKLSGDHPLKDVIKECQNTVREGFLTPLTERSSVSVEITAGMFVEEVLDNIKMKHLKILQLDELIQRLNDNINSMNNIDLKSIQYEAEELLEICFLSQPNDVNFTLQQNYLLYFNNEKLELNHWFTQPLNLCSQQQYSLFYMDQHIETISVDMIYQIANNPQNIKNTEYQQLLYLTFLQNENLQLSYELQISMKFNLTNGIKKKMIASLKQEIDEIDDKVNQEIKLITQLLEPFQGQGFRYIRGVGIVDKATQSKARNQCCNIF